MKEQELLTQLKARKLVNDEQLAKAAELRKNMGGAARIVDILVKLGYVKKTDLNAILAEESRETLMPANVGNLDIDLEAMSKIPREFVEKHRCVAFEAGKGKILLALADAQDLHAAEDVQFFTGKLVEAASAPAQKLDEMIRKYYERPEEERAAARLAGDTFMQADPLHVARALAVLLIKRGVISKADLEHELERMKQK